MTVNSFVQVEIGNNCGAQLLVNGEPVMKKRPLWNNSEIVIAKNIRFRWMHTQDVTDTRGKDNLRAMMESKF